MHPVITGAMIFTTRIDMVRAPPPYVLMNVWSTDNAYIIPSNYNWNNLYDSELYKLTEIEFIYRSAL